MGVAKATGTAPSAAAPTTRETRYVTSKSASGQPENLTLSQGKLGTVKRGMKTSYSHLGTRKKVSHKSERRSSGFFRFQASNSDESFLPNSANVLYITQCFGIFKQKS